MKSLWLCLIAVMVAVPGGQSVIEYDFGVVGDSKLSIKEARYGIVGGNSTTIEQHPYLVSVTFEPEQTRVCVGAIINKNWVVTAKYPLINYLSQRENLSVRAGSSEALRGGQKLNISRIVIHEKINDRYRYDIALIQTSDSINLGRKARRVALAKDTPKPGSTAQIVAYGAESENSTEPGTLYVATVKLLSQRDCEEVHGYLGVTSQCADAEGVGPCTGDFGSPLLRNKILLGMYSGGDNCNYFDLPEIYSNIAQLRPWIMGQIKKYSKNNKTEHFENEMFLAASDDDNDNHDDDNDSDVDG